MPPVVICERCHEETEPHLHGDKFYCDVCASYKQSERTAEAILEHTDPMGRLIVEAAVSHYQNLTAIEQFEQFDWSKK